MKELNSYREDIKHEEWMDVLQVEISTLKANKTWELTDLPSNK